MPSDSLSHYPNQERTDIVGWKSPRDSSPDRMLGNHLSDSWGSNTEDAFNWGVARFLSTE